MKHYKLFIDGNWIDTPNKAFVQDKYTGEPFASIAQAEDADVERAVQSAKNAFQKIKLSPYHRYEILFKVSKLLLENKEHIAEILSREVGKPLKESRGEVQRAAFTFEIAAEEAKRITGEMVPVEATPGSENRLAFTLRSPLGVVCAITPFNFPLFADTTSFDTSIGH
jgi:acyl-CoA reductase-like NAD-dependent aldehyde dehydrogenase